MVLENWRFWLGTYPVGLPPEGLDYEATVGPSSKSKKKMPVCYVHQIGQINLPDLGARRHQRHAFVGCHDVLGPILSHIAATQCSAGLDYPDLRRVFECNRTWRFWFPEPASSCQVKSHAFMQRRSNPFMQRDEMWNSSKILEVRFLPQLLSSPQHGCPSAAYLQGSFCGCSPTTHRVSNRLFKDNQRSIPTEVPVRKSCWQCSIIWCKYANFVVERNPRAGCEKSGALMVIMIASVADKLSRADPTFTTAVDDGLGLSRWTAWWHSGCEACEELKAMQNVRRVFGTGRSGYRFPDKKTLASCSHSPTEQVAGETFRWDFQEWCQNGSGVV